MSEEDDAASTDAQETSRDVAPADIDARFTYANERTFLAWNRTALALITAGLAITQLLPPFTVVGGRKVIGLPLIVLGVVVAIVSLRQWQANDRAMRARQPLPRPALPWLLAFVIGLCALIAAILAAVAGQS